MKKKLNDVLAAAVRHASVSEIDDTVYVIFHRRWWTPNASWPDGREPGASRPQFIEEVVGLQAARKACHEWGLTHEPGPMSDKAEFQDAATFYAQWPTKSSRIRRA